MRRKFILTIDAGGLRSFLPVMVLAELEKRLAKAGKTNGLHEHFDLVSGCGLGSLIVAALTCPHPTLPGRMVATADELLGLFTTGAPFLFASAQEGGSQQGHFDADVFETGLKAYLGAATMLTDVTTYLVIPAFDLQRRAPVLLSNVEADKGNFYLWQAVRSGCAVPGYFAPAMVENLSKARARGTPLMPLIHGGSVSNDPSLAAYVEASKLSWTDRDHDLFILSLGAGLDRRPIDYLDASRSGNHGALLASVTPAQVNRSTELDDPTPYQLNTLLNRDGNAFNGSATRVTAENRQKLRFFRINGALDQASTALDRVTPDTVARLEQDGLRLIAENSAALDLIVAQLCSRPAPPVRPMPPAAPSTSRAGERSAKGITVYRKSALRVLV